MTLVLKAWEAHCAHRHLPRSLANRLVSVGFRFDGASVFPILNLQWDDDAYSKGLGRLYNACLQMQKTAASTKRLQLLTRLRNFSERSTWGLPSISQVG